MNEFAHKFCTQAVLFLFAQKFPSIFLENREKFFLEVLEGCVLPDVDEKSHGYACHFYNPVTNTNYLGTENHAKARCLQHFARFVLTKNFVEFGRAIHFLEDICTPVHVQYEDSSDAVFKLPFHVEFEHEFDQFLKSKNAENIAKNDAEKIFAENCENFGKFVDNLAMNSCCLLNDYKKTKNSGLQREKVFENVLENAIKSVFLACKNILLKKHLVAEIKQNSKIIGYVFDGEAAANCDNYRVRIDERSREILIFYKRGTGRNFKFLEKQII